MPTPPKFAEQMGKGRPKGSVNKTTQLAKHAIAAVADGLGGVERMIAWAKEDEANERVFWSSIYTKLIPVQTELTGADGGPVQTHAVGLDTLVGQLATASGLDRDTILRNIAAQDATTH